LSRGYNKYSYFFVLSQGGCLEIGNIEKRPAQPSGQSKPLTNTITGETHAPSLRPKIIEPKYTLRTLREDIANLEQVIERWPELGNHYLLSPFAWIPATVTFALGLYGVLLHQWDRGSSFLILGILFPLFLVSYRAWVQTKPMPEAWLTELTRNNREAIRDLSLELGCPISPNLAIEYRKFLLWVLEDVRTT